MKAPPRMRIAQQRCGAWRATVRQENRTTAPRDWTEEGTLNAEVIHTLIHGYGREKPSASREPKEWKYFCFHSSWRAVFPLKSTETFPAWSDEAHSNWQTAEWMKNSKTSDSLCQRDRIRRQTAAGLAFNDWKKPRIASWKTPHPVVSRPFIVFHEIPVVGCFRAAFLHRLQENSSGRNMGEVQDVRDVKKTFVAPAVKSFEHYDFSRAKICCSLTWLVAKAYGTGKGITHLYIVRLPARCVNIKRTFVSIWMSYYRNWCSTCIICM